MGQERENAVIRHPKVSLSGETVLVLAVAGFALCETVLSGSPSGLPTSLFEATTDIGSPPGAGSTAFLGYAEVDGRLAGQYLLTACARGPTQPGEQCHIAYRRMRGECRIIARVEQIGAALDPRVVCGVMIRASCEPGEISYFVGLPPEEGQAVPCRLAVQRVLVEGRIQVIERLVDRGLGNGWERLGPLLAAPDLPDEVLVGLAIMPSGAGPTQAVASGIRFATRTELLGPAPAIPTVPADAAHSVAPAGMPGFHVRSIKATWTKGWGREQMNRLLDFGGTGPICFAPGMPFAGREAGERIVPVVNLHDTGWPGYFSGQTGYPDEPFPGVDEQGDTLVDDDDDDHFATEVRTLVYLKAGLHVIGIAHDEGVYLTVGGILVGARDTRDLQAPSDFPFEIAYDGWYPLTVRTFETTGEASLEVHEIDFYSECGPRRALLGDPVCGVSPVRVP